MKNNKETPAVPEWLDRLDKNAEQSGCVESGLPFQVWHDAEKRLYIVNDRRGVYIVLTERPRISDLHAMAVKHEQLSKPWVTALSQPGNCRSSDSTITTTHFKHVRKHVKSSTSKEVRELMNKAASEGWSAARFKDALKKYEERPENPPPPQNQKSGKSKKKIDVLKALKMVLTPVEDDDEIAGVIKSALKEIEEILKQREATQAATAESESDTEQTYCQDSVYPTRIYAARNIQRR